GQLFERLARELARALLDGALDGVVRDVRRAPFVHRGAEARIAGWVTAVLGGDRDLFEQLAPTLGLLGVGGGLGVLDLGPSVVARHPAPSNEWIRPLGI